MQLSDQESGVDQIESLEAGAGKRKRRTKKRRKEENKSLLGWLRRAEGKRAVMIVMVVMTGALALIRGEELRQAMHDFGGISIGMTAAEVRYALGSPTQENPQARQWLFSNVRHTETVSFDPAGRVGRYSCSEENQVLSNCPSILGLHIGTLERDLLLRLGKPSTATLAGGEKLLAYPGAGLTFRLRQGAVVEIEVSAAGDIFSKARQLGWLMLP